MCKEPNNAIIGVYGLIYSYQISLAVKYHLYLNLQVKESTIKTHALHKNLTKYIKNIYTHITYTKKYLIWKKSNIPITYKAEKRSRPDSINEEQKHKDSGCKVQKNI